MSLLNLATVFGPSLLRPPVAGQGHLGPTVDISQEVVVQVSEYLRKRMMSGIGRLQHNVCKCVVFYLFYFFHD